MGLSIEYISSELFYSIFGVRCRMQHFQMAKTIDGDFGHVG